MRHNQAVNRRGQQRGLYNQDSWRPPGSGCRYSARRNMKNILIVLLTTSVIVATGCDGTNVTSGMSPQTTATPPDRQATEQSGEEPPADLFPALSNTNNIKLNGWRIRYPKSLKQMKMGMEDNVLTIAFKNFSFEVRDNNIYVDGTDYGPVSKGDDVLIGLTGKIAVNGQIRKAHALQGGPSTQ